MDQWQGFPFPMPEDNPYGYPAPPQVNSADAFKTAISEVRGMMATDVVNAPQRPEPMQNPYQNPFVALGMAMLGRSNEVVSAGARIDAVNQQRRDQYDQQLLQAENYRLLRKQKLGTTLAGLQAQAGRAGVEDEWKRWQSQVSAADFAAKRADEATDNARASRALDIQEQGLDLQRLRLDQTASFTDFLSKKDNQVFASEYYGASDALSIYQRTGKITGPDGAQIDLSDPNMAAAAKEAVLEQFTANLYAVADRMRRMGFAPEAKAFYDDIGVLEKVERETIQEMAGFDPRDPEAQPRTATEADAVAAEREAAATETPTATRFLANSDAQSFDDLLTYLPESQRPEAMEMRVSGEANPAAENQMTIQSVSGRINSKRETDPFYLGGKEGRADVRGLVRAVARQMIFDGLDPNTPLKDRVEAVKFRVMQEHGIEAGHLTKRLLDDAVRQEFLFLSRGVQPRTPLAEAVGVFSEDR